MPYVLIRRSDIPDSKVQLTDLKPNTSNRIVTRTAIGQSGYVKQAPEAPAPVLVLGPPDTVQRSVMGLAAYLVDRVEDAVSSAAVTPAVAEAAAAAVLGLVRAGSAVDAAALDAELITAGAGAGTGIAAGNSFATVEEVMDIMAGRLFALPAGAVINDGGGNFVAMASGSFLAPSRRLFETGSFRISKGEGDIANFSRSDFFYNGPLTPASLTPSGFGPALVVYADDGTLL